MQSELRTTGERRDLLERAADSLDNWLAAHQRLYLSLAAGLSLLTFAGYAHVKAPWMDEVLEITIARLSGVRAIWAALMDGVQVDPPVLHSMLHFMLRIAGDRVFFAARLPAVAGFTLMCVSLACLAWRHAPPEYAAAVYFLPYATVLRVWAMDVRPYGLMMGLSALALLCWDGMEAPRHRTAWRIGFTLSLAAAFSTHFYSIQLLFPVGCGELAKWILRRRLDWRTFLSVGAALIPYLLWSPILFSGSTRFMKHYFYKAAFKNLADFFGWAIASLPVAGLLLALIAALVIQKNMRMETIPRAALSDRQRALLAVTGGFLLVPVVGYAAGVLATGFFVPYYHIIAAFGVILGIALVLAVFSGHNRIVGLSLFVVMLGHGLFVSARGLSGFVRREAPYPSLSDLRKLIPESRPDIVVPSPMNFLPFQEATRSDPENNLLYLFDAAKAFEDAGTDTSEIVYAQLRGRTAARIEPFDSYTATHRRFYIAVLGDKGIQEWQFHYLLKSAHAGLFWLGKVGDFDLFRVDLHAGGADGS